jgi:Uma2 family endonuclease
MRVVMLDAPESLLAERRKLGHDRFDEMWEGELHMVPPSGTGHQDLGSALVAAWRPLGAPLGLRVTYETGLFDPDVADFSSYRQPDVVVWRAEHATDRGVEGRAELAVEIRSPDDETYQKIPFYDRVGVRELLVVELDRSLRRWSRPEPEDPLTEVAPDEAGWIALDALPVRLRGAGADGAITMVTPAGEVQL